MHRSIGAAVLAAALLLTIGASGLVLAACGGSATADAQVQTGPSGMPQVNGQMGDPSTMIAQQLDALVQDGTITSDQQTAVAAAIKASLPAGAGGATQGARPSQGTQPPDRGAMFTTALAALVQKGTITASQQKAVAAVLASSMPGAPPGARQSTGGSST